MFFSLIIKNIRIFAHCKMLLATPSSNHTPTPTPPITNHILIFQHFNPPTPQSPRNNEETTHRTATARTAASSCHSRAAVADRHQWPARTLGKQLPGLSRPAAKAAHTCTRWLHAVLHQPLRAPRLALPHRHDGLCAPHKHPGQGRSRRKAHRHGLRRARQGARHVPGEPQTMGRADTARKG